MTRIVIVGAGPAGIAAAATLAAHGCRPLLLDEARQPGGQVYRRPTAPVRSDPAAMLGAQIHGYRRTHVAFERFADRIDYQSETLVWNVAGGRVHTVRGTQVGRHEYDALILATGATDRLYPVEGWTLPGVFSLGAAQVLLKDQGCLVGGTTAFCGSSPLLYLAALQYARAGGRVAAVVDTSGPRGKLVAGPLMLTGANLLARGLTWMAALRRLGVPIHHGATLCRIEGGPDGVRALVFRARGGELSVAADAVALGFGLRAETQLAELAGARLRFDPVQRQFLPETDADGRCGGTLYAAGDGSAIGGAEAAEGSGALAALAVLADHGRRVDLRRLRARVRRLRRLQSALALAFPVPDWARAAPDRTILCRCENISVGEVRRVLRAALAPGDVNRAKALTRCGMGRCQGRYCGLALAELMAAETGRPLAELGWLRVQAPVKPLPIAATEAA